MTPPPDRGRHRVAACLWALGGLLAIGGAFAQSDVRSIRLGPIDLNMRIPEIRQALPDAAWRTVSRSSYSGRETRIAADDAIDLGGRRLKVEVRDQPYEWDVILSARFTEPDAAACEQAGLAVLTALEAGTGPLQDAGRGEGERISFGRASTASFSAFEGRREAVARRHVTRTQVHTMVLSAQLQAPEREVKAYAAFDARNPQNCLVSITALGWQRRPPMQTLAYDESKVRKRMSIGDRHRLASGLALPADGIQVPMQCQVSRQSGQVMLCNALGTSVQPPAITNVAGRYAGAMAFDMTGVDRDDPQPMLMDIPLWVRPQDARPLDFAEATVLAMSAAAITDMPAAKDIRHAFPIRALRKGVGARVESRCQVQADGSLVCLLPTVEQTDGQSDFVAEFAQAASQLVPQIRVGAALNDGSASAGRVLAVLVRFKVED
ncbi:MAG: hypothetical protein ACKVQR_01275 [Aquabacterium sp.]